MTPLYLPSAWRIYLEVRFRDQDMGVAVLQKLKHKYAGQPAGHRGHVHLQEVPEEVEGTARLLPQLRPEETQ